MAEADRAWWAAPWAQNLKHVLIAVGAVASVAAAVLPQFFPVTQPAASVVQRVAPQVPQWVDQAIPTPRDPAPPSGFCTSADQGRPRVMRYAPGAPLMAEICDGGSWLSLGVYDGG